MSETSVVEKLEKFEKIFADNAQCAGNFKQLQFAEKQATKFRNRLLKQGDIKMEDQIKWLETRRDVLSPLRNCNDWCRQRYMYYQKVVHTHYSREADEKFNKLWHAPL